MRQEKVYFGSYYLSTLAGLQVPYARSCFDMSSYQFPPNSVSVHIVVSPSDGNFLSKNENDKGLGTHLTNQIIIVIIHFELYTALYFSKIFTILLRMRPLISFDDRPMLASKYLASD